MNTHSILQGQLSPRSRWLPLLCVIILAPSQIALAQLNEPHVVRSTVSGCLNVRADFNTTSAVIACLAPGTNVVVVAAEPYWREITFGVNQSGWAAKKYLEPATPVTTAATPTTIPANAFLEVHFVDSSLTK